MIALIATAMALLAGAIAIAYFWPAAYPLFAAAAMVLTVSFVFIPLIKNALLAYATCRGPFKNCSISFVINNLGMAATMISGISFAIAGAMQIAALGFLFSWFLAWIGVTMEAAVIALVYNGIVVCGAGIVILIGVITDVNNYVNCMNNQQGASKSTTKT